MNDPLTQGLVGILAEPEAAGLILAGGFGLSLKRRHLLETRARTLCPDLPEARATMDLDLFLRLELFGAGDGGRGIIYMLRRLGYLEVTPRWQFRHSASEVVIDLLSREPGPGSGVPVRGIRVGGGAGVGVHGRLVREAFAVEERPVIVPLAGADAAARCVAVPHPYPWLCMKVRASTDWLRGRTSHGVRPPPLRAASPKHAFDACLIVAMVTEAEVAGAWLLAEQYAANPMAAEIADEARVLFGRDDAPGWLEAQRQAHRVFNHALMWPVMAGMLGMRRLNAG